MQKKKLLFLPFSAGLVLMVYSWFLSYPLSVNSVNDVIINHLSILYWFSLPLLLGSMCSIAIIFENRYIKWMMAIGIVITVYSLSFFYYRLPGVDESAFRGLEENFIRTGNLAYSAPIQEYYQWPLFFILAKAVVSISGLNLATYEFLIYVIIGVLLATGLYLFASKKYPRSSCLAVIAFFMAMFYFLNYQAAPFSLALGLSFLLFVLTLEKRSWGRTWAILFLFLGTVFTHAFVPLFFVLYLLVRGVINKSKYYLTLFALTLSIYLVVETSLASSFFFGVIRMLPSGSEYSSLVAYVIVPVLNPIDTIAQTFSRTVTIAFLMICATGFLLLLIKKRMTDADKAVFLTGAIYFGVGLIIYTLGSRAIPIAFIPVSLGICYLFESKARRFLTAIILILVVLFAFVPLHSSFSYNPIIYQTKEDYQIANFMIEKYNWNSGGTLLSDVNIYSYILSQVRGEFTFHNDYSPNFHNISLEDMDCIIYTIGLGRSLVKENSSTEPVLNDYNIICNSGSNYVALRSGSP